MDVTKKQIDEACASLEEDQTDAEKAMSIATHRLLDAIRKYNAAPRHQLTRFG